MNKISRLKCNIGGMFHKAIMDSGRIIYGHGINNGENFDLAWEKHTWAYKLFCFCNKYEVDDINFGFNATNKI